MKVDRSNFKKVIPENEQGLLNALFEDLSEINNRSKHKYYIDYQDWHNECSPEWTDPCPDYYGYYTIRDDDEPYEIIGIESTLDELDTALCFLSNYTEQESKLDNDRN